MKTLFDNPSEILVPLLSLWQPWATAYVTPHPEYPDRAIKEYETRHWNTKVRGIVLVHASKKWDKLTKDELNNNTSFKKYSSLFDNVPLGKIIGFVEIEDVITSERFHKEGVNLSKTAVDEFWFGNWEPGRFGFKSKNPVLFDSNEFVPFKGMQTPFVRIPLSTIPEKYHHHFIKR